jgi:plastocyanin
MPNNAVTIADMAFVPAEINIQVGDTVTWTNQDAVGHSACRDDPPAFDTGRLAQGDTSDPVTFHEQGTYDYFCRQHHHMTGKVIVSEAPASGT